MHNSTTISYISYIFSKITTFSNMGLQLIILMLQAFSMTLPPYVLLVPSAFSPCPDANGGIGLMAIGSSECLILQILWTNRMQKGESAKFQVMKGY